MTRADWIVAVDTTCTALAEVDHSVLGLGQSVELPADATVCTHEVRDESPHYAVSVALSGPPDAELLDGIGGHFAASAIVGVGSATTRKASGSTGARQALTNARDRDGGRAVRFPGWAQLTGTVPLRQVLASSAIDGISQLGGGSPDPDALLITRGFVRPRWCSGELVLAVLPAGRNSAGAPLVAPFEVPNPTPCCAQHP